MVAEDRRADYQMSLTILVVMLYCLARTAQVLFPHRYCSRYIATASSEERFCLTTVFPLFKGMHAVGHRPFCCNDSAGSRRSRLSGAPAAVAVDGAQAVHSACAKVLVGSNDAPAFFAESFAYVCPAQRVSPLLGACCPAPLSSIALLWGVVCHLCVCTVPCFFLCGRTVLFGRSGSKCTVHTYSDLVT